MIQSSKFQVMRVCLFASALIVASIHMHATDAFSIEMIATPANKVFRARTSSKLSYAASDDLPQAVTTPEFDAKVRSLVSKAAIATPPPKTKTQGLPNMITASSKDELRKAVLEDEDRLTVVRFHAPYCAQCKRMEPLLRSFARRNPDIQFVDVAYTQDEANRQLVHSLGVPSFPYCHVYHPASLGLLEEHSVNSKHFRDMTKVIESYQDGGCDLPPYPNDDGTYASPYKSLLTEDIEEAATR